MVNKFTKPGANNKSVAKITSANATFKKDVKKQV